MSGELPMRPTRVTDLRLARVRGESGQCVAFDLNVADPAHRSLYFRHVDVPADRHGDGAGLVHAGYASWPPSLRRTLSALERLKPGPRTL